MENKPDVRRMCIIPRGTGIEMWVSEQLGQQIMADMVSPNPPKYLTINGQQLNASDYTGCFYAESLQAAVRRKNGEYVCDRGNWHTRNEKCECLANEVIDLNKRKEAAIAACTNECVGGWVFESNRTFKCQCLAQFDQTN